MKEATGTKYLHSSPHAVFSLARANTWAVIVCQIEYWLVYFCLDAAGVYENNPFISVSQLLKRFWFVANEQLSAKQ